MPPKKKAGKEDSKAVACEPVIKAEADLLSLRRLLELKTYEAVDARRRERSWRERAELAEAALEQARTDTADIKADLARQHNTTQEHLTARVSQLESQQSELRAQLESAQATAAAITAQNEALRKTAQEQAAAHQRHVEALQLEFTGMLKDTLDKMHARLEQQHVDSMTAAHHIGKGGQQHLLGIGHLNQQQQPGQGLGLAPVVGDLFC